MRKFPILSGVAALAAVIGIASLGSCGGSGEATGSLKGEPVAAVAPPAGKQWVEVVSKTPDGGYLIGNPNAKIKLLEFASLTCHVCADFSTQSAEEFHEKYINTGKVVYEFRNFVRDPYDLMAARIARCGSDDAFLPLTDQFFTFLPTLQENGKKLEDEATQTRLQAMPEAERNFAVAELLGIIDFFAERGVSRDQAKACISDKAEMDKLTKWTTEYGKNYTISGTPTFYLNGNKIDLTAWQAVKGKLMEAGAR
jgi:protein-disulfide isomerase